MKDYEAEYICKDTKQRAYGCFKAKSQRKAHKFLARLASKVLWISRVGKNGELVSPPPAKYSGTSTAPKQLPAPSNAFKLPDTKPTTRTAINSRQPNITMPAAILKLIGHKGV